MRNVHAGREASITREGRALMRPVIEFLIEARHARGLRQEDVDVAIGCAERLVSKYECGIRHPSLNMLAIWCQVLGVSLTIQPVCQSGPVRMPNYLPTGHCFGRCENARNALARTVLCRRFIDPLILTDQPPRKPRKTKGFEAVPA
jgi:transcriptional regulator with XRE-family HTH domain